MDGCWMMEGIMKGLGGRKKERRRKDGRKKRRREGRKEGRGVEGYINRRKGRRSGGGMVGRNHSFSRHSVNSYYVPCSLF